MSPEWIAIVLQLVSMVVFGAWIVFKLSTSVAVLDNTIVALSKSLDKLSDALGVIERHGRDLSDRVTRLEERVSELKKDRH